MEKQGSGPVFPQQSTGQLSSARNARNSSKKIARRPNHQTIICVHRSELSIHFPTVKLHTHFLLFVGSYSAINFLNSESS